jgi:hypothetical protein
LNGSLTHETWLDSGAVNFITFAAIVYETATCETMK